MTQLGKERRKRKGKEYGRNKSETFASKVSKGLTFSCAESAMLDAKNGRGMGDEVRTKEAKVHFLG